MPRLATNWRLSVPWPLSLAMSPGGGFASAGGCLQRPGCSMAPQAPPFPGRRFKTGDAELSAREVCGAACLSPSDSTTCGDLGDLPLSDRDYPQVLLLSGTQRAWWPLRPGLEAVLGGWLLSQLMQGAGNGPRPVQSGQGSRLALGFRAETAPRFRGQWWPRAISVGSAIDGEGGRRTLSGPSRT